jgi:uncharacterized membrane protein YjgN (DUF898 family)
MNNKSFAFHGTAGGYFVVFLVTLVAAYIPIFGWPVAMNFSLSWIADNATIDGRKLAYKAGYGETLKFIFLNFLLIAITLGIYTFWYVPKQYRFIANHTQFVA